MKALLKEFVDWPLGILCSNENECRDRCHKHFGKEAPGLDVAQGVVHGMEGETRGTSQQREHCSTTISGEDAILDHGLFQPDYISIQCSIKALEMLQNIDGTTSSSNRYLYPGSKLLKHRAFQQEAVSEQVIDRTKMIKNKMKTWKEVLGNALMR